MTRSTELYACLYADELPMQALLRLRPELHGQPCVVTDGTPPLQQVCSINAKARRLGIAHAMTRVEVDTFRSVTVLHRSHDEEAAMKGLLLKAISVFSPRVEDKSDDGAFLCFIDIAGLQKLFGPPVVFAENLLTHISKLGVLACVAVSRNANAAAAFAKTLSPRAAPMIIPAGEEAAALAPLPLSVINITQEQREILSRWGIYTLGMLAELPEDDLIARMGQAGQRLRQLARGEFPHPFQPDEPAFMLEERMELDSPVDMLDAVLFVVNGMLDQLIRRAESRSLALAGIVVALTVEGVMTPTYSIRPALPTNEKLLWIKLLHVELEAHPPHGAILALTITAEPSIIRNAQLCLFTPQLPEPARLDVTLARIRAIVGEGCVGQPVLLDTHQPQSFRIERFAVPPKSTTTSLIQTRAAVRKLRRAETISVTVQNSRLETLVFRGRRYIVKQGYGPWMTSGNWWGQSPWNLEQWDVVANEQEEGRLLCCCLSHDLIQNCWQLTSLHD